MNLISLGDLEGLSENVDFGAKKAAGADARGECPRSLFESYSAMANTDGGVILLGADERDGKIQITGIADLAWVQKALRDGLNNRQGVSANLMTDRNVEVGEIDGSAGSSEHKGPRSEHTQGASSEHNGQAGADPALSDWAALEAATAGLRSRRRAPPPEASEAITRVCSGRFLTLSELSRLLGRKPDSLRVHYLAELLATGQVRLRYPDTPTHPDQGYTNVEADKTK